MYSLIETYIYNHNKSNILNIIRQIIGNKEYDVSSFFSNFHNFESPNYVYNSI